MPSLKVFPRVLSLALLCAAAGCSGGPAGSGSESDGDTDDGGPSVRDVVIPLGETLFLGGDDYLSFWGVGDPAAVELVRSPEGATAEIIDGRLTPDVAGAWELRKDGEKITVHVDADYLNEDTFLNYNYTPVQPLLAYDAQTLWVASPPSNAIQEVLVAADGSLSQGRLVATGSWPVALARWGELLLVAQAGRDSVALVDPALGIVVDAIEVGDEPATIVVDGDVAYVALGGRGEVAKLDLSSRAVVGRVDVGRKTRALALDAARGRLFAASLISSNGHPQGLLQGAPIPASEQRDIAVIDTATFEVESWIYAVGTMLRGLYVDGDRLLVSVSHSRNDIAGVEADSRPHAYALAVVDIADGSASQFEVVQEVDLDLQASSTGPAPSPFSITRTSARNGSDEVIVSLSAGHKLLVFPGGDIENLRPFTQRQRVVLGGRRGFARLALQHGAPIIPVVSAGGHETLVVLSQGRRLAKAIGADRLARVHSLPLIFALPWGLLFGPMAALPYLPLPAKITVQIGHPIEPAAWESMDAPDELADELYLQVEQTMQYMLSELYQERLLPVVG